MDARADIRDQSPSAALDRYLADCVTASLRGDPAPAWPADLQLNEIAAIKRVLFHGIALILVEHPGALDSWPSAIAEEVREEARRQSFWEDSHRTGLAPLLDALHEAGIEAVLTKGTALAYAVYTKPAARRRGDSDLVILNGSRSMVRQVFQKCGFEPSGDKRPLQETWQTHAPPNFTHQVDLHWRINASAAIAERLERIEPGERAIPLDQISPHARALSPADNLILIAINRAAHRLLGYTSGDATVFEGDRLIWAVDIDLIARTLDEDSWEQLASRTKTSGTQASIASALSFAKETCGTAFPDHLFDADKPNDLSNMLDPHASWHRLRLDLAASPAADKVRFLRHAAFPSPAFVRGKYPQAAGWPLAALHARRWVEGVGKILRGGG